MKNVFISFSNGDNTLMYTNTLTIEECRKFAEKCASPVEDIYILKDDELQYYLINGRVHADTPELEDKVRKIIQ